MKLRTERLDLVPLNVDIVDAMIAGDAAELLHATGARFETPLELPPMFDRDTLGNIRDQLDRRGGGRASYLAVLKETSEPVGIVGLNPTGEPGTLAVGYSVYPSFEGQGLATEATQALINMALRDGTSIVRATVPPGHQGSIRVAEKVGMRKTGTAHDEDAGEVLVYEIAD